MVHDQVVAAQHQLTRLVGLGLLQGHGHQGGLAQVQAGNFRRRRVPAPHGQRHLAQHHLHRLRQAFPAQRGTQGLMAAQQVAQGLDHRQRITAAGEAQVDDLLITIILRVQHMVEQGRHVHGPAALA